MKLSGLHIYKASAGAGKTYKLALYYLGVMLSSGSQREFRADAYRDILAMTFTNKAATEMKDRIINFLHELSELDSGHQSELLTVLCDLTGLEPDEVIRRSGLLLHSLLHNYSDLSVMTLDKFMQSVIRSFSRDLKLSPNLGIQESEDTAIQQVVDELLDTRIEGPLWEILMGYSEYKTQEGKSFKIADELVTSARQLSSEKSEGRLNQLRSISIDTYYNIIQKSQNRINELEKERIDLRHEFNRWLSEKNLSLEDMHGSKVKPIFGRLINTGSIKGEKLKPEWHEHLSEGNLQAGKATPDAKTALESGREQLIEWSDKFYKLVEELNLLHSLLPGLYQTAVLSTIEKSLAQFKLDNNLLFFIDFNRLGSNILREEPIPFIYERVGVRYNHLMLDEFQDTSVQQWQNLLPLLLEVLSKGGFGLIVGDDKQAIYRFRNGNAEQFTILPDVAIDGALNEKYNLHNYTSQVATLPNNYRSSWEIVNFNNAFFQGINVFEGEVNTAPFIDAHQHPIKNHPGYITISFSSKEDSKENHLFETAERIKDLHSRGYTYKDIAILVQRHAQGANYASYLTHEHNIPVVSSESLYTDYSPAVQLILSYLKHTVNPQEDVHRLSILKYYAEAHSKNYTSLLSAYTSTNDKKGRVEIGSFLASLGGNKTFKSASLYVYILEVIDLFNLRESDINLQYFLDSIIHFRTKDVSSLSVFLEWWEQHRKKQTIRIPERTDAVKIMTIHRSKGLEFPAVLLPSCDWDNRNDNVWLEEDAVPILVKHMKDMESGKFGNILQEEKRMRNQDILNLAYVAFTRPQSELHIMANSSKGFGKELKNRLTTLNHNTEEPITLGQAEIKSEVTSSDQAKLLNSTPNLEGVIDYSLEAPEHLTDNKLIDEKLYGTLFHNAISRVFYPDDIYKEVAHLIEDGEVAKKLAQDLQNVLSLPEVKKAFEGAIRHYPETEFVGLDGEVKRADRVIVHQDRTIALEFKTGESKSNHVRQLQEYGEILRSLGEKTVELYLIYVSDKRIERIPCLTS